MLQKTVNGVPTGDIDFSKLFMGLAIALVYIMQSYHAMQVADIKASTMPRAEAQRIDSNLAINAENIKKVLADVDKRLTKLEEK